MVRKVVHKGGVSARLLPLVIWPRSGYVSAADFKTASLRSSMFTCVHEVAIFGRLKRRFVH
jgi:hypothetical protein